MKTHMPLADLLLEDEIYFIDLETVGGNGICQIGITRWSKADRRLSLVFDEIINPDVPLEFILYQSTLGQGPSLIIITMST
jgi:hypothetical protein